MAAPWSIATRDARPSIRPKTLDRVIELVSGGTKQSDIARELGVHRSNVSRAVRTAKDRGLLS